MFERSAMHTPNRLTPIQWLICAIAAIGFAFDTYELLMLPLIIYYLASAKYWENKETIALLYFCFVIQLLTSGISTGQEDRLIVTALPLWIVAYLLTYTGLNRMEKLDPSAAISASNPD